MGIEFKLTDREFPASPAFVLFLDQQLQGGPVESQVWPDQRSEALSLADPQLPQKANEAAARVMASAAGRAQIAQAYQLFVELLTGNLATLRTLHSRYQFITINGIARSGGSYLTAELYRALGMQPACVPHMLAHDSFPELGPFRLEAGSNSWLLALKMLAEWLTMVQLWFCARPAHAGRIVVPKKLAQSVYAGALVRQVLGEHAQHLLTLRHPAAACVSSYEKSGGLPPNGRFAVRSNIEGWCVRDLAAVGLSEGSLQQADYFDLYLKHWELYHTWLVTSGLAAGRVRVLAFGREALQAAAQRFHDDYGSGLPAERFEVSDKARRRHPDWVARAEQCLARTAALWQSLGTPFPLAELTECW